MDDLDAWVSHSNFDQCLDSAWTCFILASNSRPDIFLVRGKDDVFEQTDHYATFVPDLEYTMLSLCDT